MSLRSLEVCAGIGGMTMGFALASPLFEPAAFCEIEPYPRAVLTKHYPGVPLYDDLRALSADALAGDGIGRIDLLCGGIPCQPHSQAGKRLAGEDDRDLWPDFARLLGELRPRWAVVENVAGLLSSDSGRFFGGILRDLARLGLNAEWHRFPASAVGALHERERVWIVAYPNGVRPQGSGQHRGVQGLGESRDEPRGSGAETRRRAEGVGYNTLSAGLQGREQQAVLGAGRREEGGAVAELRSALRHAAIEGLPDWAGGTVGQPSPLAQSERSGWWTPQPGLLGVADGVPGRVPALKAFGNAIVPQAAQVIGYAIAEAEETRRLTGSLPAQIVRPEHIQRVRGAA